MWLYNGVEICTLPDFIIGFVYEITNNTTGKKYIGKKLTKFSKIKYKTVVQKNGFKKKKKIRFKVDSDWREYYGSNIELNNDVQKLGVDAFERNILHFCYSKAECSYLELKEQVLRNVLESDLYYNGIIQVRIHKKHILT